MHRKAHGAGRAGRAGHLFPKLLRQSEYNDRVKNLAPLMEAALRWLAEATPFLAMIMKQPQPRVLP